MGGPDVTRVVVRIPVYKMNVKKRLSITVAVAGLVTFSVIILPRNALVSSFCREKFRTTSVML